ncbi:MAG: glycosyltransferase [Dokdonella sp.]|nr:glycosyltransferase [Dokdonella sp.]
MRSVPVPSRSSGSHILIFEPDSEGHPREWLEHIAAFADAAPERPIVSFVVAADVGAHMREYLRAADCGRIRVLSLRPLERRLCTVRFLTLAALTRWWLMRRYVRRTGAHAGHFLSLDYLCVPLALGLGLGGPQISGILFRPSVHYATLGPYRPNLGERLRDLRKALLYRLTLLNRHVAAVLSLDPYFPSYAGLHYRHGAKVHAIPDPAYPSIGTCDRAEAVPARAAERCGLVMFGYLSERKGLLVLLDALGRIGPKVAASIAVNIAGRIDPVLRGPVAERVRHIAVVRPELIVRLDDRWLPASELDCLVRASDVVLAPYQRFVGSSGVLLWAARTDLPLLTQDFGLLGRLVREHRLGLTTDTTDPDSLAHAIERMVTDGPRTFIEPCAARSFVAAHTSGGFASSVLRSHGIGQ